MMVEFKLVKMSALQQFDVMLHWERTVIATKSHPMFSLELKCKKQLLNL
jgi:hypothetical protein